jgi:hypothetical protein
MQLTYYYTKCLLKLIECLLVLFVQVEVKRINFEVYDYTSGHLLLCTFTSRRLPCHLSVAPIALGLSNRCCL